MANLIGRTFKKSAYSSSYRSRPTVLFKLLSLLYILLFPPSNVSISGEKMVPLWVPIEPKQKKNQASNIGKDVLISVNHKI